MRARVPNGRAHTGKPYAYRARHARGDDRRRRARVQRDDAHAFRGGAERHERRHSRAHGARHDGDAAGLRATAAAAFAAGGRCRVALDERRPAAADAGAHRRAHGYKNFLPILARDTHGV